MEAIELLKEAEQMIKELQDAYVRHDGAIALRRKIRKFIASQHTLAGGLALESAKTCALDFGGYACSCGKHESQAAKA